MITASMKRSTYANLPERFFSRVPPTPVAMPRLLKFNHALAAELGLETDGLDADALAGIYSGNVLPQGVEPIAATVAQSCWERPSTMPGRGATFS
jgi:uncharacterized protein YdiU (UPF0061 family)